MKRILLLVLLPVWAALPATHADELVLHVPDDCGNLRVEAVNQPLSDVLKGLADQLTFTLHFSAAADHPVTATLSEQPAELLRNLLARDNIVLTEQYDPVCKRKMPASLWVLGEGEYDPNQLVRYAPAPAAIVQKPPPTPEEKAEKKRQGHRKYMTPEERYNDRIRRRLEKNGAAMVSGGKEKK